MKIVVNTDNYEILNSIIRAAKEHGNEIVIAKLENKLFELMEYPEYGAFILTSTKPFSQKAVDFIKRESQYTPIVVMGMNEKYNITGSDIMIPFYKDGNTDFYAQSVLHNIYAYNKNFDTLQRLTAKMQDTIEFGDCTFDPQKRLLYYKGNLVFVNEKQTGKLSPKQAGILELLAANFAQIVKKDIIMEKVWHQTNYFVGRSLDVFVTHLRNILAENEIKMSITNVSNVGLMLDLIK
jgi:DNA-binding winged helix-turn-helix (wHTH) protein